MATQQQSPVLLATDQSGSVLRLVGAGYAQSIAYTPFGFHAPSLHRPLPGFNGQVLELLTLGYALGNGYRHFNPALQRFPIPDDLSPFGEGGINAYVYCAGDPQNFHDPSGHSASSSIGKGIANKIWRTTTEDLAKSLYKKNARVIFGGEHYGIYPNKLSKARPANNQLIPRSEHVFDARTLSNSDITFSGFGRKSTQNVLALDRTQLLNIKSQSKKNPKALPIQTPTQANPNPYNDSILNLFTRDPNEVVYRPYTPVKQHWLLNPSKTSKRVRESR